MNNKNRIIYYLQYSGYSCLYLITFGAIFQTFMLECGVSEAKVSFSVSVMQIVQTAAMLLISKWIENVKNVLLGVSLSFLSFLPLIGAMLLVSLKQSLAVDTKYILLFGAGIVLNLGMAVYGILSYKQPHHIMNIKDYGEVSGQSGVIAGILGFTVTAVMSFVLARYSYFGTMVVICIACVVITMGTFFAGLSYKKGEFAPKIKNVEKINIFKYRPFYVMALPNFMRGISSGIFNLITVIGYYCKVLDASGAVVLVTLSQVATLVSCQTFAFISRKRKLGLLCLVSSTVILVSLPLMLLGNAKIMFMVFYFIAFFFTNYITYGVPAIVAENIDYNCLGQYTAWRMGLYTLGISVGGILVPVLLKFVGAFGALMVCGITMAICGVAYYLFEKSAIKNMI